MSYTDFYFKVNKEKIEDQYPKDGDLEKVYEACIHENL